MLSAKKKSRKGTITTIATWSLSGRLKEPSRQEELFMDMKWKKVDVAALQETLWSHDATATSSDVAVTISSKTSTEGCRGLAFYLSPKRAARLASTRVIDARAAVARLKALNADKADLVMINACAPTMMRTKENREITEAHYQRLRQA